MSTLRNPPDIRVTTYIHIVKWAGAGRGELWLDTKAAEQKVASSPRLCV